MKRRFVLVHAEARSRAKAAIDAAPDGDVVEIREPSKRRIQEEKYHAMIGDIAKQCLFMGKHHHAEDWKRLLVDAFAKAMRELGTPLHHDGRVIPSLDYERVVQLGIQTSDFYILEASNFIEFLFAWGSDGGVVWTDPKRARGYAEHEMTA